MGIHNQATYRVWDSNLQPVSYPDLLSVTDLHTDVNSMQLSSQPQLANLGHRRGNYTTYTLTPHVSDQQLDPAHFSKP